MTVKRPGKCVECNAVCVIVKQFDETVDMFGDRPQGTLTAELSEKIKEWRKLDMYCEEHK